MILTHRFMLLAACVGFACLATPPAKSFVILGVNLSQTQASPDEPGFTNWLTGDNSPPQTTTINGFGLTATGVVSDVTANGFRSLDRPDNYNGPLDNLTETWWGARAGGSISGGVFSLRVSGLAARDYDWTSWHHDHSDQRGIMDIAVSVDGGANYTNVLTGFGIVNGNTPAAPNPAAFAFTANGTDDVIVRFTNTSLNNAANSGTVALVNGFQIAIPEPSTASLFGAALALVLLRRRR